MASYNKDKKVRIFQLVKGRDSQNFIVTIKKYIHPLDKYIRAYIRDLSSKEIQANKQAQDDSTLQVIINRRYITKDMYLEYKRRGFNKTQVYNITSVDYFDDSTSEMKLTLSLVKQDITYDSEEGTEWN